MIPAAQPTGEANAPVAGSARWAVAFAVVTAIGLWLTYRSALWLPFESDARFLTHQNAFVRDPWGITRVWTADFFAGAITGSGLQYISGYYRPVTNALFWLEYRFAGPSEIVYAVDQLALHWLNACLVFLLVLRVARDRLVAVLAAALFAFHPMHAFAATQVKARSDVLFACFYLLALLAYEHAWRGRRDAPHPGALALAAGLSLLSVLSKEMGVTLPLALLVLHALWIVRDGMPVRAVVWTAPFWMVLAGYAAFRFGALGLWPARVGYGDVYSAPVLYLNLTKNVTIHLLRMLVPHGADYPELFPTLSNVIDPTLHDPQIHLSIALIVLLIGVAVALRERAPVVAFGIAFFLVSLAPLARVENIAGAISVTHIPAQERFAYLPSIGIFLLIAAGGAALHGAAGRRRRILYAAAGLALLVALARMASVHALSADSWLALLKQYALVPEERLTRLDRVNQLILYAQMVSMPRGELADAEERTRAAVRLAPDSPMPAVALSNVLAAAGRWSDVAEVLEPWQSPADARLREMQHTNFRIADDLNRTSTYVAYLSGRALAHTGHADAAAERLCRALASGFDLASIRSALHENEALNGAPHCIDAADPGRCIAEAPGTLPPDDVRRCGSAE